MCWYCPPLAPWLTSPSQSLTYSSQEERGREGKQDFPMSLTLCHIRSIYRQRLSFCFSDLPCPVPLCVMQESVESIPDKAIAALKTHLVNLSVSWMDGMHSGSMASDHWKKWKQFSSPSLLMHSFFQTGGSLINLFSISLTNTFHWCLETEMLWTTSRFWCFIVLTPPSSIHYIK